MNIFAVHDNYVNQDCNKTGGSAFNNSEPTIYVLPETALLKGGKPFFVPEYAQPCSYEVSLVVRIGRLGRHIAPRFAYRYYDAVTVGVSFTADNLFAQCCAQSLPWDISKGFDGAAVCGRFVDIDEATRKAGRTFALKLEEEGGTVQQADTTTARHSVDNLIAYISRFCMLRQGDLIFTGYPCKGRPARLNTRLTAYLDDALLLGFNVK